MAPTDPAGMPQTYGIDDVQNPPKLAGPEGMDEENLEPPNTELPKSEISDEKGETSGPKG